MNIGECKWPQLTPSVGTPIGMAVEKREKEVIAHLTHLHAASSVEEDIEMTDEPVSRAKPVSAVPWSIVMSAHILFHGG